VIVDAGLRAVNVVFGLCRQHLLVQEGAQPIGVLVRGLAGFEVHRVPLDQCYQPTW
jgi:hypothetical protein